MDAWTDLLRRRRGAPEDRRVWDQLVTEARRRELLPAWAMGELSEDEPGFDPASGLPRAWRVPGLAAPFLLVGATPPLWVAATPLTVADVRTHLGAPVGYLGPPSAPAPHVTARQALELAAALTAGGHQAGVLPPRWRLDLPTQAEWEASRAAHPTRLPGLPGAKEWTRDVSRHAPRPGAEARRWLAGEPPEELGETDAAADVLARLVLRGVAPW